MAQNVDEETAAIKRFLDALEAKKKDKKDTSKWPPSVGKEVGKIVEDAAKESTLQKLIRKQRERNSQQDFIQQNMLYSKAAGANPAPGVVPAGMLGYDQPDPERGLPMGVDVSQMSDKDRERVLSRIKIEDQEWLAKEWERRLEEQGAKR